MAVSGIYAPDGTGKLSYARFQMAGCYRCLEGSSTVRNVILSFLCVRSVLGTPFYIMEYVNGRIFKDPALPGLSPDERRQVFSAATDILSRIHKVNIKEAGLEDYGKAGI